MDDELLWLRNAAPPTHGPSELARRGARQRLVQGIDRSGAARQEARLEILPLDGITDAPLDTPTTSGGRSRNQLVAMAAAAALVLIVVAGALFGGGNDGGGDEETTADRADDASVPPSTTPAPSSTPAPTATAATTTPAEGTVPTISVDSPPLPGEVVTVRAPHQPGDAVPPLFEICASAPPGCVALSTNGLLLGEDTATADVPVPLSFDAADGFHHDCTQGGCHLRVAALTHRALFAVESTAPTTTTLGLSSVSGLTIELTPSSGLVDGGELLVEVTGFGSSNSVEASMCPPAGRGRCDGVHVAVPTEPGRTSFSVRLPRRLPVYAEDEGRWQELDCAVDTCRLEVRAGNAVADAVLPFDPESSLPSPALRLESRGTFELDDQLILSGTGFMRSSDSNPTRANWVLCGELPATLDDVGSRCGTPRSADFTTVDRSGGFRLPVHLPDPATVLTWAAWRSIDCDPTCWLVVLTDPFPSVVGVPIDIR